MEQIVNILIFVAAYLVIPVAVRYVILRRPIENHWIAIGILAPIFIGFSVLINIQRDEMGKKIAQVYGMPYSSRNHMLGTPILFGAMVASFYILRHGRKRTEKFDENTIPFMEKNDNNSGSSPAIKRNQSFARKEELSNNSSKLQINESLVKWPLIKKSDEDLFQMAHSEWGSESRRPGLWAKCIGESLGEEKKAEALYINYRASQLILEKAKQNQEYLETYKKIVVEYECHKCGHIIELTNEELDDSLQYETKPYCQNCGLLGS